MVPMLLRHVAMALALAMLLLPLGRGVVLRSGATSQSVAVVNGSAIPTKAEITEKWDKMDEFLEIMFTIACKWKHGKDVHGQAVAKGGDGKIINKQEVLAFKKELRSQNVKQLNNACGAIVANGKGKCRQSCADRWGVSMAKRSTCDGKCVAAYAAFEKSCKSKAANLQEVYAMKVKMADSRETCYEGHCAGIPTAWMKADEAAMVAEVDTQCASQCTADRIKTRCEQKFQVEVDFLRGDIEMSCHDQSTVKSCFKQEKTKTSTAYDTCVSTNKGTCDTQFADCKTKGKVDSTFKQAKEFCEKRKKMCTEQVDSQCLKEHKEALDKAKAKCEKDAAAGEETCVSDALTAKETEVVNQCKTDLAPKCTADCKKTCEVTKMNQCLSNLDSENDPAEHFCQDFWQLLHESSGVDPITGDPIVLLSQRR